MWWKCGFGICLAAGEQWTSLTQHNRCAIVSHPADVLVSKLNANRQPGEAFGAAVGRIYKDIGFMGMYSLEARHFLPHNFFEQRLTVP
jgi:hypothetical protein